MHCRFGDCRLLADGLDALPSIQAFIFSVPL